MMLPFKPLLSPKNTFMWTDKLDQAFVKSKAEIIKAITHGDEIFDPARRTGLCTDYSEDGIGYYLGQKHCDCELDSPSCCPTGWRITLAGSRFLKPSEKRFSIVEGEALGIAWACFGC